MFLQSGVQILPDDAGNQRVILRANQDFQQALHNRLRGKLELRQANQRLQSHVGRGVKKLTSPRGAGKPKPKFELIAQLYVVEKDACAPCAKRGVLVLPVKQRRLTSM